MSLRHFSDVYSDLDDHLLVAAEHAFRALARDSPAQFAAVADGQRESNSETVVFLVLEGYSANPAVFADDALDSLTHDPRRLREGVRLVVDNLLDNAALHGGSEVRVGLRAEDDQVIVAVEDDGPGIAPDEHERLLQPFARGSGGGIQGTGLGLAIVAQHVAAHGGT